MTQLLWKTVSECPKMSAGAYCKPSAHIPQCLRTRKPGLKRAHRPFSHSATTGNDLNECYRQTGAQRVSRTTRVMAQGWKNKLLRNPTTCFISKTLGWGKTQTQEKTRHLTPFLINFRNRNANLRRWEADHCLGPLRTQRQRGAGRGTRKRGARVVPVRGLRAPTFVKSRT